MAHMVRTCEFIEGEHQAFRLVEGDTADRAVTAFVRRSGKGYYLAVFNCDPQQPKTLEVPLKRIDASLAKASGVALTNALRGSRCLPRIK